MTLMTINGYDAFQTWGITPTDDAVTALMTPAPLKDYVSNESPLAAGKEMLSIGSYVPKADSRDVQIKFNLCAATKAKFLANYNSFCTELAKGYMEITLPTVNPDVVYRCYYQSCSQYSQFNGKAAKFLLKVTEPDPTNRTPETTETAE